MTVPTQQLTIRWDGTNWTDETSRLVSFSFRASAMDIDSDILPKASIYGGSITLDNTDWRYSPRTGTGVDTTIHSYISSFPLQGINFIYYLDSNAIYNGKIVGYEYNETDGTVIFNVVQ